MSKKKQNKKAGVVNQPKADKGRRQWVSILLWIVPILLVTGVCLSPMLSNEFTNWDDEYYVVQNALLRGPDWAGIFTKTIVSNYHPVTIMSLALNYSIGQLDPTSYFVTNLILHLLNTGLVFYFIWLISAKRMWVAAFCALIFGIHPMHVESVVWISERKDVLYTFFFFLSLIQYWRYLHNQKYKNLVYCFILFGLSILSKPAAIILPFMLVLMDYWVDRKFVRKSIIEKIPFLIVSIVLAAVTVASQSKTAMAGLDFYPIWIRALFACYTTMIYITRFFVPYPLSAFHPFPPPDHLGLTIYLSPLFMIALLALVWLKRKNKLIVFSFFFFMINIAMVSQVVSIGGTLIAERYTYVPYTGLAFLIGSLLDKYSVRINKYMLWALPVLALAIFGYMTFQRSKVWKDSETLWTDTIKYFPHAPVPRTNRANHLMRKVMSLSGNPENAGKIAELTQRALEDCNEAIRSKPNDIKGYENRQNIYLRLNRDTLALADAKTLLLLQPRNQLAYYVKGVVYLRFLMSDSAMANFNKCLEINPNNDFALNNRGSLLFNVYKKYKEAMDDFNKAININPQGEYHLNRSYCYYTLGDRENAKRDANIALQKGYPVPDSYRQLIGI